ncbi:MAG: hypothetical protein HQK93_03355, partial [Nitrospirae bacterium]|nr:hypothetical protein [Nitrospirota bacterium]
PNRDESAGMMSNDGMMMGFKWWQNPDFIKKLAITDSEKTTLDNLYVEKMKNMIDHKAGLQKEMLAMQQILEADTLDEAKAMATFKEHQDSRINLETEQFKFLLEVRKLLGAARFKELKSCFNYSMMMNRKGKGLGKGSMMNRSSMGEYNPYCSMHQS